MTSVRLAARGSGRIGRMALATVLHALLVLGPLAGYLVYQHGHAGRVEAAHFRTIAGVATETSQRLDHLRHLFSYANTRSAAGSEAWLENARVTDQPAHAGPADPAPPGALSCATTPISFALLASPAGARVQLERPACAAWRAWCACPPQPWIGHARAEACARPDSATLAPAFEQELRAQLRRYHRAGMLVGGIAPAGDREGLPSPCAAAEDDQPDWVRVAMALGGPRHLDMPLADLLGRASGTGRFHTLLVLGGEGQVVYASDASWPARISVGQGKHDEVTGAGQGWLPSRAQTRAELGALYAAPLRVTRAGLEETLFCTPLPVRYPAAPELTLCGAVESAALDRDARALAPDLLALVVLVFLLSVCAVPLLKVWLIGPHEAFRRADLALAAAGTVVGAALLTVLLAWAGWTLTWRAQLDTAARQISAQVRTAFADELDETAEVLARLAAPGADVKAIAATLPPWGRLAFRLSRSGQQVGPLGTAGGLGELAAPAQVANRDYFQNALRDAGTRLPLGARGQPGHAAVEQVLMRGHGIKATAFAVPVAQAPAPDASGATGTAAADAARVAVLLRGFDSLARARLPTGFRLVVFDAGDGTVQFHTDSERALAENFFREVDAPGLRAQLHAGQPLLVGAEYSGAAYRFHLQPLHEGWPWWVAVGRQEGLWRAASFDLVAGALPVIGLLLAALGGVGLALGWLVARLEGNATGHALAWLWPHWGRRYGWRVAALAGVLGGGIAALAWATAGRALTLVLVLGVAALAVMVEAARDRDTGPGRAPAAGYLSCLALLLVLVGVLPAAAVVRDLGAWVEAGYQRVVQRDYVGAPAGTAPGWYFPPALVRVVGAPDAPAPYEESSPAACREHPGACVLAAGIAPDLSDAHVEALRQSALTRPPDERSDARLRCRPMTHAPGEFVCSPRLAGFLPGGRAGVALGALAALLAFLGMRVLAGAGARVFGFAMGGGRLAALDAPVLPPAGTRHVLVVRPPCDYGARLARVLGEQTPALRVRRVDLRVAEFDAAGMPRWPAALGANNDVVILEEFDAHPRDARWSLARLELLEKLLFRPDPRVIVLSDMSDPARIALDLPDTDAHEALAARWGAVLRELALVRHPAQEEPAAGTHTAAQRVLADETGWSWRLDGVAAQLREQPGFADLPVPVAMSEITARAWPLYRHLWSLCTQAERLVLAQLAHGAQLNPRQYTLIRQLLRRGVVRRAPEFRLAGEGFAAFVREAVSLDEVNAWERASGGGTWQSWRVPLLVAVLVGGALLFVTQRDTFQAAYALGGAALAAVPVLVRAAQGLRAGTSGLGGGGSAPGP